MLPHFCIFFLIVIHLHYVAFIAVVRSQGHCATKIPPTCVFPFHPHCSALITSTNIYASKFCKTLNTVLHTFMNHDCSTFMTYRATVILDPACSYTLSLQPDLATCLPTAVLSHAHALWAMVQVCVCVCVCVCV